MPKIRSGKLGVIDRRQRLRSARCEPRIIDVVRRAIRANDIALLADVEIDMRVIERRQRAHALELLRADFDLREPLAVVEMRNAVLGHSSETLGSFGVNYRNISKELPQ